MNIRTIASIAALSLAALGFAQASAGAAEDERFRQGGTGRAAQPAPAQRVAPPQGRAAAGPRLQSRRASRACAAVRAAAGPSWQPRRRRV